MAWDIGAFEFSAGVSTATYTASLSLDAWLYKTQTKTSSFDGLLFKSGNLKTSSFDGLLLETGITKTSSFDGLVTLTDSAAVTLDAEVIKSGITKTTSLGGGEIYKTQSRIIDGDALLFKSGDTVTTSLDARVGSFAFTSQPTLSLDGIVSALEFSGHEVTSDFDAIVGERSGFHNLSLDAHLFTWYQRPTPTTLYWDPYKVLPLTNPTTYSVSTTDSTVVLSEGEHAIIALPRDEVVQGQVSIISAPYASRPRIWVIGGRIENSQATGDHKGLDMNNVDAYVEGVHVDKLDQPGDAFQFRGSATIGGTLWFQNNIAVGVNHDQNNTHGDGLQLTSQITALFMDLNTLKVYHSGVLWDSDNADQFQSGPAIKDGYEIRRTNIELYPAAQNTFISAEAVETGHIAFTFANDCGYQHSSGRLTDVWAYDPDRNLGEIIRPISAIAAQSACSPSFTGAETLITFPASLNIEGGVRYGIPPSGDFVTHEGLGYTSPWIKGGEADDLYRPIAKPSVLWGRASPATNPWIAKSDARTGFWDAGATTDLGGPDFAVTGVPAVSLSAFILREGIILGDTGFTEDPEALTPGPRMDAELVYSQLRIASLDADLSVVTRTTSSDLDAWAYKQQMPTVDMHAFITGEHTMTTTLSMDSYVLAPDRRTRLLEMEAVLSGTRVLMDGRLIQSVENPRFISADALLLKSRPKTIQLHGALSVAMCGGVPMDSYILVFNDQTAVASMDAMLFMSGVAKTTSLDASLIEPTVVTKTMSMNGMVNDTETRPVSMDARLVISPAFASEFSSAFDTSF